MITVRVMVIDDDHSDTRSVDMSKDDLSMILGSIEIHLLDIAEGQTHESDDKEYYDRLQDIKGKLMGIYPILT